MIDSVKKKGGARAGAGAKPKYGCKTVTMRVPADRVDEIQAFILKKKNIDYSAVRKTLIRQKENIVPRQGKRQSAVGTQ